MKVVILTCAWKRPDILRAFLCCTNFLKEYKTDKFHVECLVVASEQQSVNICEEYNTEVIVHKNNPVSNKWNAGLQHLRGRDFDYLLILGSDDLMTPSLLESYYDKIYLQGIHFGGVIDSYVYDCATDRLLYYEGMKGRRAGEPVGSGRFIHRELLDSVDWKLWHEDLNESLDYSTTIILHDLIYTSKFLRLKEEGAMIVDLKGEDNITPFENFIGEGVPEDASCINNYFTGLREFFGHV